MKDVNTKNYETNHFWGGSRSEEKEPQIRTELEPELDRNKKVDAHVTSNTNTNVNSNFKQNINSNVNPSIDSNYGCLDPMQQLVYDVTDGNIIAELHHVYTIDGFELNLYRMVRNKNKNNNSNSNHIEEDYENTRGNKEVFCLNHGLFESCINFAAKGYNSLAFEIFMNGHDVWLCNNRGNNFTRYVGRKVAWRKLLERYDLQELEKDLGFCTPPNMMTSSKLGSLKPELEETMKKRKGNQCTCEQNNLKEKTKYCSNVMCWSSPISEETQIDESIETTSEGGWNYLKLFSFLNRKSETLNETVEELELKSEPESTIRKEAVVPFLHYFISLHNERKTKIKEKEEIIDPIKKKSIKENTKMIRSASSTGYNYLEDQEEEENEEASDWTFEDMSTKDLPVIIKYIKSETKKDKIVFIGFSQGSIQLLISSCLNEFVSKSIKQCYLISLPIILRNKYELLQSMKLLIRFSKCSDLLLKGKLLAQRFLPDKICELVIANTAHTLTHKYLKYYNENIDNHYKKVYFYHTPNGNTSAANLNKWIEGLNNIPVTNIIEENIHRCSFPKTLIYGSKDTIVDPESSIQYMNKIFKTKLKIILHNNWSHLDPVWSDNNRIVSSYILNDMKNEST